jgi:hypothetical protein
MKKLLVLAVMASLLFVACNENDDTILDNPSNDQSRFIQAVTVADNSDNIKILIDGLDYALQQSLAESGTSDAELGEKFLYYTSLNGLPVLNLGDDGYGKYVGEYGSVAFKEYMARIGTADNYRSESSYLKMLDELRSEIYEGRLDLEEKQVLIDKIDTMSAFVSWAGTLEAKYGRTGAFRGDCSGWWSCWGKCVAGIIGTAIGSGVAGCGVGAAVGGVAASIIPGAGTAAGAVGGCVAGGVVGAIGGALEGAANHCD